MASRAGRARTSVVFSLSVILVALASSSGDIAVASPGPPAGEMVATLVPGCCTEYSANLTDPDGDPLSFNWSSTTTSCGHFFTRDGEGPFEADPNLGANEARWEHRNAPHADNCTHDAPDHPGTIIVIVLDGTGWEVTCTKQTSSEGTAPCTVTEEPPTGECEVRATDGYFEPVQGVWQDEPLTPPAGSRSFPDLPGKQLTRLTPFGPEAHRDEAELDMVRNRPSLLFGIDHAVGGPAPKDRFRILLRGTTTCQTAREVKMRFTLIETSENVIYTSGPLTSIGLDPPAGAQQPWTVALDAPLGIPPDGMGTFTFQGQGSYLIKNELIRVDNDQPTGLFGTVEGEVVGTRGPRTAFFPITLDSATAAQRTALVNKSNGLAADSALTIPDQLPLPPGGITTVPLSLVNLAKATEAGQKNWLNWFSNLKAETDAEIRSQARMAVVDRLFQGIARQSKGTQRIVVVLTRDHFDSVVAPNSHRQLAGFASSQKVVVVHQRTPLDTVPHELIHTMPFLWTSPQMRAMCGSDYHGPNIPHMWAHAFRITERGVESRLLLDPFWSLMTSKRPRWMDQCTYWHLLGVLSGQIPDPPLILVQGRIAQHRTRAIGQLFPAYQQDGIEQLAAGDGGRWAIVLRDAAGAVLGRFPFSPGWKVDDTPIRRSMLPFTYLVPDLPGTAQIDLVGPRNRRLARRVYSDNAPTLTIDTPLDGAVLTPDGGKVTVSWTGSDADGDRLLYTVLYSDDGGQTFLAQSFEQAGTTFDVAVSDVAQHVVRIVVTDGARSAEAEVGFST